MRASNNAPARMTPRDFFYKLQERLGDGEMALIAYGVFESDRYRWVEARERAKTAQIDAKMSEWIESYDEDRAISRARELLSVKTAVAENTAAIAAMKAELAKKIPSARKAFNHGVVAGVAANFVFSLILLACAMIFRSDPSLNAALKTLFGMH